jgi:DNA-binding LytR/AlgR family response regulator
MIKILIVEDEMIIAEHLTMLLESMDYVVVGSAIDYNEAIELLETESPDLVLLDISLGGKKDGVNVAETINERFKLPIIFTTSHSDEATIERAKKVNPANYLLKPFQKEQLFTAIEIALFNWKKPVETETSDSSPEIDQEEAHNASGFIIKDALFLKEKFKYTKVQISEIKWIKADGNYLELHLADRREIIRTSLTAFLLRLDRQEFFRTHKSYAVNLDHLTKFEPTSVTISATEIPLSKTASGELLRLLEII